MNRSIWKFFILTLGLWAAFNASVSAGRTGPTGLFKTFDEVQRAYLQDPKGFLPQVKAQLQNLSFRHQPQAVMWYLWFLAAYEFEIGPLPLTDFQKQLDEAISEADRLNLETEWIYLSNMNIYRTLDAARKRPFNEIYDQLLQQLRHVDRPDLHVYVLSEYAATLFQSGDLLKASQFMLDAQNILENNPGRFSAIDILRFKSRKFFSQYYQEQFEMARSIALDVIAMSRDLGLPYFELIHLSNLGMALAQSSETSLIIEAKEHYQKVLELAIQLDLKPEIVFSMTSIAKAHSLLGDHRRAIEIGLSAIEKAHTYGVTNAFNLAFLYTVVASSEVSAGLYEEGRQHAEIALQHSKENPEITTEDTDRVLYEAYAGLGNQAKAYEYLKKYMTTFHKISKEKASREYQKASVRLGLETMREENALARLRLRETERMRIVLVVLLVLSLVIIAMMIRSVKEQKAIKSGRLKMQRILDNIDEGILTIDHELRIESGYSAFLNNLFPGFGSFEHRDFVESVLVHFELSLEERGMIREVLRATLGEESLAWEFNSHMLPLELRRGDRYVALHWVPLQSRGHIHKVLLSMRDITERKNLEKQIEYERIHSGQVEKVMAELFQAGTQHFGKVLHEAETFVQWIEKDVPTQRLKYELHSLKGLARQFGCRLLSQCCHQLEDRLSQENTEGKSSLLQSFKATLQIYQEVWQRVGRQAPTQEHHEAENLYDILQNFLPDVRRRLKEQGIKLQDISMVDEVQAWNSEQLNLLGRVLVHVLNNSVDHGFILPRQQGRSVPDTRLWVTARLQGDFILIQVQDNGAGINYQKLQELALQRGLSLQTAHELIELLFEDGVTTTENVSETSGRGQGLPAIRSMLRAAHGEFEVSSKPDGSGTLVSLYLPHHTRVDAAS